MTKAHLLTIGTEITSGEVVNSNAAWIGTQLENLGVRVHSHLSVRDQREEILAALKWAQGDLVVVTGGLGPTTDDITRACFAEFFNDPLEFDEAIWQDLVNQYAKRKLPLREAHRHQCHFPKTSERLKNPAGSALGFYKEHGKAHYFVLPGPPRELEAMWKQEVLPRLKKLVPASEMSWHRWTFFAIPESEVGELVEKVIAGTGLEVGYRAQVPYVKVKLFAHPTQHQEIFKAMDALLPSAQLPSICNLVEEILRYWPSPKMSIADNVSEGALATRLYRAWHDLLAKNASVPKIYYATAGEEADLKILMDGDGFNFSIKVGNVSFSERRILPFKIPLDSELGRRYAAETALWLAVNCLKPAAPCHT